MRLLLTMLGILLAGSLAACDQGATTDVARDEEMAKLCQLVLENLTEYARENGGLFPEQLNQDLLKDGRNQAIVSPYTGQELFPVVFGSGDASKGNICYIPLHEGSEIRGFILLGFGDDAAGSGTDVDGDGQGDNVVAFLNYSDKSDDEAKAVIRSMQ